MDQVRSSDSCIIPLNPEIPDEIPVIIMLCTHNIQWCATIRVGFHPVFQQSTGAKITGLRRKNYGFLCVISNTVILALAVVLG